jgi:hypothetical protein
MRFSHTKVEKFFFTTATRGNQLVIWTERAKRLNEWRAIADKYRYGVIRKRDMKAAAQALIESCFSSEFDLSVYNEDNVFFDLIDNMPTDTWQSILGTLICMAVVCFVFLFHIHTVIIATGCVLSICVGMSRFFLFQSYT